VPNGITVQNTSSSLERLQGLLELILPVDLPVLLHAVLGAAAVEEPLRVARLHEAAEDPLSLLLVEVLHFLIDPLADQLADGDPLRRELQRHLAVDVAAGGFIANGEGDGHEVVLRLSAFAPRWARDFNDAPC
jgi:hypothetical protein